MALAIGGLIAKHEHCELHSEHFDLVVNILRLRTYLAERGSRQHDPSHLASVLRVGGNVEQNPSVVGGNPHLQVVLVIITF